MPDMRSQGTPIAVLCSDLHLSHQAPIARSGEPDWYEAMARPLREMGNLASRLDVPIVCAGDVFDTWRPPPELINFAMDNLPEMYAIPGQHDLPMHSIDLIHRSAFWTLAKHGVVNFRHQVGLHGDREHSEPDVLLLLYAFGEKVDPARNISFPDAGNRLVCVTHQYLWCDGAGYPGAPDAAKVGSKQKQFKGYRLVVSGDNHIPFEINGSPPIFNCGGFMRRKSDEQNLKPSIGILFDDLHVERHYLDISQDVFQSFGASTRSVGADVLRSFIDELGQLNINQLDFEKAIEVVLQQGDWSPEVKSVLREALTK